MPRDALAESTQALTTHLIGRAVLAACVEVLEPRGVRVMPLKGIWLQEFVYAGSGERVISDVDVLVAEGSYLNACAALDDAGWKLLTWNDAEASYLSPGLPLALDLHARLFRRGAFQMLTAPLFERSTQDNDVFGVPVALPDAGDVLAHLVGHALKSGNAWSGEGPELRDIPRLADACRLSALDCAARLDELGLARAARFVLPLTAADDAAGFGAAVLSHLRPDVLGDRLAQTARLMRTHMRHAERMSALIGFALDSSLLQGAYAFSLRISEKFFESANVHSQHGGDRPPFQC
ncbi:MAG: hypothetical protein RL701_6417 [Pseudomonadota bacterium]|jgi:hypothetical protein